jgi:hypothetical protein
MEQSCPKQVMTPNVVIDFIALTRPYETFDPFVWFDRGFSARKMLENFRFSAAIVFVKKIGVC